MVVSAVRGLIKHNPKKKKKKKKKDNTKKLCNKNK